MAHGQGATSNRTGGYGAWSRGSRGHGKDKAVRKAEQRANDPRWQAAMEETRKHQEELDRLIAEQAANPVMGVAEGALIQKQIDERQAQLEAAKAAEAVIEAEHEEAETPAVVTEIKPKKFSVKTLKKVSEDKFQFAETTARIMLKQGYHIQYVIDFTGIGYDDLNTFLLDEDGYGMTEARLAKDREEEELVDESV